MWVSLPRENIGGLEMLTAKDRILTDSNKNIEKKMLAKKKDCRGKAIAMGENWWQGMEGVDGQQGYVLQMGQLKLKGHQINDWEINSYLKEHFQWNTEVRCWALRRGGKKYK